MEVAGDPDDFMPIYSGLDKTGDIYKDIERTKEDLKKDKIVGKHLQRDKVPKYYIRKYGFNAYFKVVLPENWRLIYGITSIDKEKYAILMEVFDHIDYNKRFGFKKK
jgi:hypothetical protein